MSQSNGQQPAEGQRYDDLGHVADPDQYKQRRLMATLLDRRDEVLARRATAYEAFWDGRINHSDYLKAFRMAVEDFILDSEQAILGHPLGQWYWAGEPPTVDNSSPFNAEQQFIAVRPDEQVELPDGGTAPASEVAETDGLRLQKPMLVVDRRGRPPFGTAPNALGKLRIPEQDRELTFYGLNSILQFPDPLRIEFDTVERHPIAIKQKEQQSATYQIPERVLMNAYRQCRQFWADAGMSFDFDSGLPVQKGFNPAEGEFGHVERVDA